MSVRELEQSLAALKRDKSTQKQGGGGGTGHSVTTQRDARNKKVHIPTFTHVQWSFTCVCVCVCVCVGVSCLQVRQLWRRVDQFVSETSTQVRILVGWGITSE